MIIPQQAESRTARAEHHLPGEIGNNGSKGMPVVVLLNDIVDALEMQFDGFSSFLDLDTDRIETLSDDLLSAADKSTGDYEPDLPDCQKEEFVGATRILSSKVPAAPQQV
jgi:hypothetical protein